MLQDEIASVKKWLTALADSLLETDCQSVVNPTLRPPRRVQQFINLLARVLVVSPLRAVKLSIKQRNDDTPALGTLTQSSYLFLSCFALLFHWKIDRPFYGKSCPWQLICSTSQSLLAIWHLAIDYLVDFLDCFRVQN